MSDLRGFATPEPIDPGNTGKILGAVFVALAVCAAGTYSYETGMWNSPEPARVASIDLPSASATPPPAQFAPPAAPAQNVPVQQPAPQAAAPVITTPHRILAQHSPRAILPPNDSGTDQSAPAPAQPSDQSAQVPTAPAQAAPDVEPQSAAQPQQDVPAQNLPQPQPQQPDGSQTPQ